MSMSLGFTAAHVLGLRVLCGRLWTTCFWSFDSLANRDRSDCALWDRGNANAGAREFYGTLTSISIELNSLTLRWHKHDFEQSQQQPKFFRVLHCGIRFK